MVRDGFPPGTSARIYTKVDFFFNLHLWLETVVTLEWPPVLGAGTKVPRCWAPLSVSCSDIPTSRLRSLLPRHTLALNLAPPCSRGSQGPKCDILVLLVVLPRLCAQVLSVLNQRIGKECQRTSVVLFKKRVKGRESEG